MKPEELLQTLVKMVKETETGKLKWRLTVQTTEGNEEKYTVEEEGNVWIVDECYVSYDCTFQGKEFCMITYEMIRTLQDKVRTVNYVFIPPKGIRLFSLHTLLEHSVKADAVLISQVHTLWETLMKLVKEGSSQVDFQITQADVNVEEDM
jgi:hypothetical protein